MPSVKHIVLTVICGVTLVLSIVNYEVTDEKFLPGTALESSPEIASLDPELPRKPTELASVSPGSIQGDFSAAEFAPPPEQPLNPYEELKKLPARSLEAVAESRAMARQLYLGSVQQIEGVPQAELSRPSDVATNPYQSLKRELEARSLAQVAADREDRRSSYLDSTVVLEPNK